MTIGTATSAMLFAVYWLMLKINLPTELVKTFIFATFATYTLLASFSLRSLRKSIFIYNPFSNLYLVAGVLIGIGLTAMAVYHPFMQKILGTRSLPLLWIYGVLVIGILNILAIELGKWFYNEFSDNK